MPYLSTPRGRFFYRQAAGADPTLVFLHGNLGSSRWWRPTLDRLPAGWRGVAFDGMGFGYSDHTDRLDRFAISAQALDLAACVDALGLGRFHVIAHSTATPVAIEFALSFPSRAASLALVGPVPAAGISTPAEAYPVLERLPHEQTLLAQAILASAPTLNPESPLFAELVEDARRMSPLALVAIARGLDAWSSGARLKQLTLPVLLVRGAADIMLSAEEAESTLLAMPGANNLEVFQGVGHSPMLESPDSFAATLCDFVSLAEGE